MGKSGAHVAIAAIAIFGQGCGWILQSTFVGYSHEETRVREERYDLRITPTPNAATLYRVEGGELVHVGDGPSTDTIAYEVSERYKVPESTLPLFLGGFLDAALMTVGIVLIAKSDIGTPGKVISLTFGSMIMTALSITEWTFAGIWGFEEEELLSRDVREKAAKYVAKRPGYQDLFVQVIAPGPRELAVDLVRDAPLKGAPPPPPPVKTAPKIVAVMEVRDLNAADPTRAIDPLLRQNVGDQLRVFVAAGGFSTIDRGAQESVLADHVAAAKADSYKSCYDERCQIELGKALAAQFILRSQITRFGSSCVLNGELIDLAKEIVVTAGAARGDCSDEGFYEMTEALAASLVNKAR